MNKKERGELIVESAKRLFAEQGYHNTTVSDIIVNSKIARSTFYAHFESKLGIFQILVRRYSEILLEAILSINISRAAGAEPLAHQIREMTELLVNVIDRNRDLTKLLITAPLGHDNDFDRGVQEFFSGILLAIRRLLVEGIEGATIRRMDPDIISYVILGSVKQILLQWLVYTDVANIRDSLNDIIEYTLYGIAQGGTR